MNRFLNFIFFMSVVLFVFVSCNKTQNSEPEAMFMKNPQHTSFYQSAPIINQPRILWKFKTGGQVISSPVVAGGKVFAGSADSKLYALNASDGEILWTFETGGSVNSTPLVTGGKVLFLSYDGFFYALNENTGEPIWKFKTGGESVFKVKDYFNGSFQPDFWDFYLSSATVKNGTVYFGSSDSNIYALDLETGEKKWSYFSGGSVHSSPAIWENSLVVGAWDSRVYCLDTETGDEKWVYTTGRDTENYIWLGIQASPSIDNGVAYIGSRDARLYAFDISSGDTLWTKNEFKRSWMPSSAAIGSENIYTGSSDAFSFFGIDKQTGTIKYSTSTKAYTFSTPAIDGEMAYIGSANGRLYGIDLETGDLNWTFQTEGSRTDTIGFFNDEGNVNIERVRELSAGIEDMPTLTKLYTRIFEKSGSVLSSPAIDNQVIYFGSSDGNIYAVTDKE
jgi:outer membrane protein assembly factor BamB